MPLRAPVTSAVLPASGSAIRAYAGGGEEAVDVRGLVEAGEHRDEQRDLKPQDADEAAEITSGLLAAEGGVQVVELPVRKPQSGRQQ